LYISEFTINPALPDLTIPDGKDENVTQDNNDEDGDVLCHEISDETGYYNIFYNYSFTPIPFIFGNLYRNHERI